mmetsp:Transcript_67498/g.106878  ORF Transcript_67498/g.106878 Transcript_67498/m.106878 type:complete len:152 (+) Transcript_67498:71-526(+)
MVGKADGASEKKSVRFLAPADTETDSFKPPNADDNIINGEQGVHYDPAGVSETYNIYTGKAVETKTQRKSEDAVLASQKAEAEQKQRLLAQGAVLSTSAFNAAASGGRQTRSRTAVAAVPPDSMEVESNSGRGSGGRTANSCEKCTECVVM